MNPNDESTKKIEDLNRKMEELQRKLDEVDRIVRTHTHSGNDGSDYVYNNNTQLKPGQQIAVGRITLTEASNILSDPTRMAGGIVMGDDNNASDGSNNAQVVLDFNPTNDTTNFTGSCSPIFVGSDGLIVSGGSTMTTNAYKFRDNSLAGLIISVTDPTTGDSEGFEILSNTQNTVTVDGSWSMTLPSNGGYFIQTPVYLGFSLTPWRRIYAMEGTTGGLRFGLGTTNNGQNGMLYMNSAGDLFWRDKGGTSTQLN